MKIISENKEVTEFRLYALNKKQNSVALLIINLTRRHYNTNHYSVPYLFSRDSISHITLKKSILIFFQMPSTSYSIKYGIYRNFDFTENTFAGSFILIQRQSVPLSYNFAQIAHRIISTTFFFPYHVS